MTRSKPSQDTNNKSIPTVFWVVGGCQSGRTTLANLLVDWLLDHFTGERVLAVDNAPSHPWLTDLSISDKAPPLWSEAISPWVLQHKPMDRGLSVLPPELDWAMNDCVIPLGETLDGLALGSTEGLPRIVAHWLTRCFKSYDWVVVDSYNNEDGLSWLHALEREPIQLVPIGIRGNSPPNPLDDWLTDLSTFSPEGLSFDWVLHSPQPKNQGEESLIKALNSATLTGRLLGRLPWINDSPQSSTGNATLAQAWEPLALRLNIDRLKELQAVISPLADTTDEAPINE